MALSTVPAADDELALELLADADLDAVALGCAAAGALVAAGAVGDVSGSFALVSLPGLRNSA